MKIKYYKENCTVISIITITAIEMLLTSEDRQKGLRNESKKKSPYTASQQVF